MEDNFLGKINVGTSKYSYDLTFGFKKNCNADIYKKEFDKYAPPTPPFNFFDSAIAINGERYYSKILNNNDNVFEYSIFIQFGDNKKINLKWNNLNWDKCLESCILCDAHDGKLGIYIDMLSVNKLEITNNLLNVLRLKFLKKSKDIKQIQNENKDKSTLYI